MRKVIKLLTVVLTILLVPIVIGAGFYGFLYWKVTKAADEFALQVSPFAEMSYQKVHIDPFETEIGLNDITLAPVGGEGDFLIESIRMRAPSWSYYFDFEKQINNGEIPESFDLRLNGVIVDLESDYMQDLANMASDMQPAAGQNIDALACGERTHFSLSDIKKMRYNSLSSDISLLYFFDKEEQVISFDFDSSTALMMDVGMEVEVAVTSDDLNVQTLMFAQPQLKKVEMRYQDRGYNNRRMAFCAKETNLSAQQYRENYRTELQENLTLQGWVIPNDLFSALDKMNSPRGSAYMRIDLPQGFGPQSLSMVQSPSDLLTVLNPYVEFNGQPVQLDGLRWEMPDPKNLKRAKVLEQTDTIAEDGLESSPDEATPQGKSNLEQYEIAAQNRPSFTKKPAVSYKEISLSGINKHIGQKIQLRTYFGRRVEGELIAVSSSEIKVEHRLVDGRGTAIYPIAKNKIESIKLYH
ncbi:MAG: hypothetical protein ACRBBR_13135 [Cellvibrionaceae bacterium]